MTLSFTFCLLWAMGLSQFSCTVMLMRIEPQHGVIWLVNENILFVSLDKQGKTVIYLTSLSEWMAKQRQIERVNGQGLLRSTQKKMEWWTQNKCFQFNKIAYKMFKIYRRIILTKIMASSFSRISWNKLLLILTYRIVSFFFLEWDFIST